MRTTLAIADDVVRDLKALARDRGQSLTAVANSILRAGLATLGRSRHKPQRFREDVADLGAARLDLTKALAVAAVDEDAEWVRRLELRQ
jgi:hypothetical protein